jgi:hypothetical protein
MNWARESSANESETESKQKSQKSRKIEFQIFERQLSRDSDPRSSYVYFPHREAKKPSLINS